MSDGHVIRTLERKDHEQALKILSEGCISAGDGPWTPGRLEYYSERGSALVAEYEGAVVGYLLAYATQTWNIVWVRHIVVLPQYRLRGIARQMHDHLLADVRSRGARVVVCTFMHEQTSVLALHEKLGFDIELLTDRIVARMQVRPQVKAVGKGNA